MPYVPSKKTDGKSTDREVLDAAVEALAEKIVGEVTNNLSLIKAYRGSFFKVANFLVDLVKGGEVDDTSEESRLALAINEVSKPYGYEGACLGELNYSITRLIQRVPGLKVEKGEWEQELRYWMYAATVEALICTASHMSGLGMGIGGVFEDIKDEYKRRVNTAYEAEQIIKSGDCYDTPYYTRRVEVLDEGGNHVGSMEVMLKRSESTLRVDVLDRHIVLVKDKNRKQRKR